MLGILVMLNNYFHDFAIALVVVCAYGMLFMVRYAEKKGGQDSKQMILALYPKMVHLTGGSVVFVFIAGIIRAFTYKEFEWNNAVESGQVLALTIKHIILFILFAYGIYLWLIAHRKVRSLRKEIQNQ